MTDVNMQRLQEPFGEDEIKWRIRKSGVKQDGNPWARIVPYPDARSLMDRLDAACGPENWRTDFIGGPAGGVLCSLAIRVDGDWVSKEDGAENTDIESVKGGLTDAFKRACVMWNVGGIRRLYRIGDKWAVFSDDGQYEDKVGDEFRRWDPPGIDLGGPSDAELQGALAGLDGILSRLEEAGATEYVEKVRDRLDERESEGKLTMETIDAACAHAEKKLERVQAAPEPESEAESGEGEGASEEGIESEDMMHVTSELHTRYGEDADSMVRMLGTRVEGLPGSRFEAWDAEAWQRARSVVERVGEEELDALLRGKKKWADIEQPEALV